ncbi:RagB/SusD family nutrient uptake outer membrane protein [Winogradskyella pelagia]|nr:RagB/SusD family nutrient uptake outer membrane protein [Winogradskyella sp. DF17]
MNNKLFLLLLVGFLFASCNDAIDITPEDEFTPEITFESLADLQQGLNGVYANFGFEEDIEFNSIFADNGKPGFDNGGQLINLYNWVFQAASGSTTAMWNNYYDLINAANRVIEAAPLVEVDPSDIVEYNNILGQLYALRAVGHFRLHMYYTTDYENPTALSAIISPNVPVVTDVFPRNTVQEMSDFIADDIALAEQLIDPAFTDNAYVTQDFVMGLKARVALLTGDASGIAPATALINKYPLASPIQYLQMYADADNTEVIFRLIRSSAVGGIWYFTNSAGPFFEASNSLYNDLAASNDVRLGVNINFGTNNGGPSDPANNIHLINKYPGSSVPFVSNIKQMKVSEMYLIRAELRAKNGQLGLAADDVRAVRNARGSGTVTPTSYSTVNEAITDITLERRLELAYEGHRYLDLKRNKDVLGGILRNPIDCASGGNCEMLSNDPRLTFPIPQVEVNANPGITQNPGYNN